MNSAECLETVDQLCTFRVGGRQYAVDVLDVREINTESCITPVSHAPRGVRGLVNIRGQVFLIFDVGRILGYGESRIHDGSRLVLFKEQVGPTFGILVDEVGDILRFPFSELVTRRPGEGFEIRNDENVENTQADGLIRGVCKLEDRVIVFLEPRGLTLNPA